MKNNIREFLNLKGDINLYDSKENLIYWEDEDGGWGKFERDSEGRATRYENVWGDWFEKEYDSNGNETYCRDSNGEILDNRKTCDGKEVEIDGKTYILKVKH